MDMGSGVVYRGGKEMTEMQTQVFRKFVLSNSLHIDVFPGGEFSFLFRF